MGFDDYLDNYILIISDIILLFGKGVVHLVFYFYIKQSDFGNIFDLLDSSPLLNFRSIIVVVEQILILYSMSGKEENKVVVRPKLKY